MIVILASACTGYTYVPGDTVEGIFTRRRPGCETAVAWSRGISTTAFAKRQVELCANAPVRMLEYAGVLQYQALFDGSFTKVVALLDVPGAGKVYYDMNLLVESGDLRHEPRPPNPLDIIRNYPGPIGFWLYVLLAIVAYAVFLRLQHATEARERMLAEEAARVRDRERRLEEERLAREARARALDELEKISREARDLVRWLPIALGDADSALDEAARELHDMLYSPFWEKMEAATGHLGEFVRTVNITSMLHDAFKEKAITYGPDAPVFSLDKFVFPDSKGTDDRLRRLYREAQKNPHFAIVYEQRRTNTILIEGFQSLGDAVRHLGDRISSGLDSLGSRIVVRIGSLEESLVSALDQVSAGQANVVEAMERGNESVVHALREVAGASDRANDQLLTTRHMLAAGQGSNSDFQDRALHMMDNIQRRRTPGVFDSS